MALTQPEQPFELPAVEADDDLAIDHRDGCGPVAEFQQLLQRRVVLLDVLIDERNSLVRKKLFLLVAGCSARLTVDDDLLCHQLFLLVSHFAVHG